MVCCHRGWLPQHLLFKRQPRITLPLFKDCPGDWRLPIVTQRPFEAQITAEITSEGLCFGRRGVAGLRLFTEAPLRYRQRMAGVKDASEWLPMLYAAERPTGQTLLTTWQPLNWPSCIRPGRRETHACLLQMSISSKVVVD